MGAGAAEPGPRPLASSPLLPYGGFSARTRQLLHAILMEFFPHCTPTAHRSPCAHPTLPDASLVESEAGGC